MSGAGESDPSKRSSFRLTWCTDRLLLGLMLPICFVIMGICSVRLGQDGNWDLLNYHFYIPYAFLHGRMGHDINPTFMQTYLNPLLDVPFYLMARHLPPRVGGFLLGGIHGLNPWLILLLTHLLLPAVRRPVRWALALLFAVAGAMAPANWMGLGRTFNDNYSTIFVLAALYALMRGAVDATAHRQNRTLLWIAAAGYVAGLGTGLKLTGALYSAGLLAASLALPGSWRQRGLAFFVNGCAGLAGLLTTSGFWFVRLWRMFRNPVFPAFNALFQSPYAYAHNYEDGRWFPKDVLQTLFYPFYFGGDTRLVGEFSYRTYGLAAVYALFLLWLVFAVMRRLRSLPVKPRALVPACCVAPLLVFVIVSYALWQKQFSYLRYLGALEILVPLLLVVAVEGVVRRPEIVLGTSLLLVVGVMVFNDPSDAGRTPWTQDWFDVWVPPFDDPDNTLVLLHDRAIPVGFTLPYFPPGIRFLRTQDNLLYHPYHVNISKLRDDVAEIIRHHKGPIHVLVGHNNPHLPLLGHYGLEVVPDAATRIHNKFRVLFLWEARRLPDPAEEMAAQ